MPTYELQSAKTGRSYNLTRDTVPSEEEIDSYIEKQDATMDVLASPGALEGIPRIASRDPLKGSLSLDLAGEQKAARRKALATERRGVEKEAEKQAAFEGTGPLTSAGAGIAKVPVGLVGLIRTLQKGSAEAMGIPDPITASRGTGADVEMGQLSELLQGLQRENPVAGALGESAAITGSAAYGSGGVGGIIRNLAGGRIGPGLRQAAVSVPISVGVGELSRRGLGAESKIEDIVADAFLGLFGGRMPTKGIAPSAPANLTKSAIVDKVIETLGEDRIRDIVSEGGDWKGRLRQEFVSPAPEASQASTAANAPQAGGIAGVLKPKESISDAIAGLKQRSTTPKESVKPVQPGAGLFSDPEAAQALKTMRESPPLESRITKARKRLTRSFVDTIKDFLPKSKEEAFVRSVRPSTRQGMAISTKTAPQLISTLGTTALRNGFRIVDLDTAHHAASLALRRIWEHVDDLHRTAKDAGATVNLGDVSSDLANEIRSAKRLREADKSTLKELDLLIKRFKKAYDNKEIPVMEAEAIKQEANNKLAPIYKQFAATGTKPSLKLLAASDPAAAAELILAQKLRTQLDNAMSSLDVNHRDLMRLYGLVSETKDALYHRGVVEGRLRPFGFDRTALSLGGLKGAVIDKFLKRQDSSDELIQQAFESWERDLKDTPPPSIPYIATKLKPDS